MVDIVQIWTEPKFL